MVGARNRQDGQDAGATGTARIAAGSLFVDGGEGFVGCADQRGGFVEDYGDGDVAEQAFEFPLVLESVEERAVFDFFDDFDGDAASHENATQSQHFQSEIAGFRTVDGSPEIEDVATNRAGEIESVFGDLRGG